MIVSFSGIDSSGKSTQIQLLYDYCLRHNIKVKKIWGKARGTPGVLFLKELVRRDKGMPLDVKLKYREQIYSDSKKKKLLLFASLLDLCWYFGIYYRLLNLFNDVVICDRYVWDTYVEVKNEFRDIAIDSWLLWKLFVLVSPKPDISIMLVIPAEESIRRDLEKEDLTVDSLEMKNNKIALYMDLVKKRKWTTMLDGMNDRLMIHQQVLEEISFEN